MVYDLIVYNSAKCNLKCRYCFISKNSELNYVDEKIEKILKNPQYYIDQLKKINVKLTDIKQLSVWGAEPLLAIERIFPLLTELISANKNFNTICFSTNCSHDQVLSGTKNLMDFLSKYPYRNFTIYYQISIDGPKNLNDMTRGAGVTDKILKNFNELINNNFFLTNNIKLIIAFKATVDNQYLDYFLNRDNLINYYRFFEDNFICKINNNNQLILKQMPTPNFAIPNNYSKEDGIKVGQIFTMLYQLEKDNEKFHYFKYYKDLVWLKRVLKVHCNNYNCCGGFCGTGRTMVGILPDGYYCVCHRVFANFYENYNLQYTANMRADSSISQTVNADYAPLIFKNSEEFFKYQETILRFYDTTNQSTTLLSTLVIQIRYLAKCGQIDSKYINEEEALKAAQYLTCLTAQCAGANIDETGCFQISYFGWLRLLLNGALDILSKFLSIEGES